MVQMKVNVIFEIHIAKPIVFIMVVNMFFIFIAGQPMTGQCMFGSNEKEDVHGFRLFCSLRGYIVFLP